MQNQINAWIQQIDAHTAKFREAFGAMDGETLNHKPNPDTWSVAQNLHHLIATTASYAPLLEAMHAGTYKPGFMAKIGFMRRWMGNMILKGVEPERKKKIKTFRVWEPSKSDIEATILADFEKSQEDLKAMIRKAKPLLESGAFVESPANKNIAYNLDNCFEIIVRHQLRHFKQAKEVTENM